LDDTVVLVPPSYAAGAAHTRVERNVFVNQNHTFNDLGGIDITDDVVIGPNLSLITSSHPINRAHRANGVIARPMVMEKNVWIAAGATLIGAVAAPGLAITRDGAPKTLVAGNPAKRVKSIAE